MKNKYQMNEEFRDLIKKRNTQFANEIYEELARETLKKRGFSVDNLWSIQDVIDRYECTEEKAHEVLSMALTNDYTMQHIFLAIDDACAYLKIELKEEVSCDNCGSVNITKNSSGDISCTNCGWEENQI